MADEMNVTAVTVKRWENEDGIPGKAAQEKLISICQKEKIDLAEVVEENLMSRTSQESSTAFGRNMRETE